MDTYVFLQHYWWFLISLLGALLVFLLFVQGGQGLLYTIGKTEEERNMIVNSLGRKWEFTFTTLVTFGGAFFASFPLFYSTSFGGAFYVWMLILLVFVIAKSAYSLSLVVYDSMLTDITDKDRMDEVSSHGYAWGYIGSCIPFIISLLLVLFYDKIGISMELAMGGAFLLTAIWWVGMAFPLIAAYQQKNFTPVTKSPVSSGLKRLARIFSELKEKKKILFFLIAFFFFIDGVYTIIDMATAYGTALGLDTTGLLLALLLTQIVAFPAALIFGFPERLLPPG